MISRIKIPKMDTTTWLLIIATGATATALFCTAFATYLKSNANKEFQHQIRELQQDHNNQLSDLKLQHAQTENNLKLELKESEKTILALQKKYDSLNDLRSRKNLDATANVTIRSAITDLSKVINDYKNFFYSNLFLGDESTRRNCERNFQELQQDMHNAINNLRIYDKKNFSKYEPEINYIINTLIGRIHGPYEKWESKYLKEKDPSKEMYKRKFVREVEEYYVEFYEKGIELINQANSYQDQPD
jgi:hypothetical protein